LYAALRCDAILESTKHYKNWYDAPLTKTIPKGEKINNKFGLGIFIFNNRNNIVKFL
jgi:hypothetical protein